MNSLVAWLLNVFRYIFELILHPTGHLIAHFSVFKKHPEWIKECHDLGMKVNAWTVNDAKDMERLISQGVDFITTNEPVLLQEILKKK